MTTGAVPEPARDDVGSTRIILPASGVLACPLGSGLRTPLRLKGPQSPPSRLIALPFGLFACADHDQSLEHSGGTRYECQLTPLWC
jgi:hypothetical protein